MFEHATADSLAAADDAAVVAVIEEFTRIEAAAAAARLAAVAELTRRRVVDGDDRDYWACDCWDSAASEVAAAMGNSHRAASREMRIGIALCDRLPRVAALYADGRLSSKTVSTITWRTRLVTDLDAAALIDAAIADEATGWGTLSGAKLERAVDFWVDRFDPGALVRTTIAARDHDFRIGASDDVSGTTSVWGRLSSTDAEVLRRRLAQMLEGVCVNDPRTAAQRRSAAIGQMSAGAQRLACRCGTTDCPAARIDAAAAAITIHVLADEAAVAAKSDGSLHGDQFVAPQPPEKPGSAVMTDGTVVPVPLVADLIARGAKVTHITKPDVEPEKRYRPSAALARFVRARDMTCRFPGCSRPAESTDFDHTVPHPAGATHASNGKCLCRLHHLLKTFWAGPGGWTDRQLPDGTVTWTSPAGCTYTTTPGSRLYFPSWNTATAALAPPKTEERQCKSGLTMPRRRRTRAQDHAQRIRTERALNDAYVAERNAQPP
ncbi:DUF222 domain-containing protein [Mycolicibacterium sp. S2-37]|uniref:HNH endonuclease signature motif containing protein n=1 Tax=Mycolicibacterium sp. S2-37 TaxID=2810297 RepID=UPI001A94BD00|nr:HNH endonuclease signature motif containing protein [Mycolicibacterium sp. S2-37]MBO0676351.1 DUF222 domain-containing protein [Mycolicibacterium sp. S2-37]